MGSAVSEFLQVLAVMAGAYVVLTGVAVFLKAESATWKWKAGESAP